MSKGYRIRRGQQSYEAPTLDILKTWIQRGRVMLDDEILTAEHGWRVIQESPEIYALFPSEELIYIRRDDQTFKASSFILIQEWARMGKLKRSDQVYFPQRKTWIRVGDAQSLSHLLPSTAPPASAGGSKREDSAVEVLTSVAEADEPIALETVDNSSSAEDEAIEESESTVQRERPSLQEHPLASEESTHPRDDLNLPTLADPLSVESESNEDDVQDDVQDDFSIPLESLSLTPHSEEDHEVALPTATAWGLSGAEIRSMLSPRTPINRIKESALSFDQPEVSGEPDTSKEERETPVEVPSESSSSSTLSGSQVDRVEVPQPESRESAQYQDGRDQSAHPEEAKAQNLAEMTSSQHRNEQRSRGGIKVILDPYYDAARLFLVAREMRPLDYVQGRCDVPSFNMEFEGQDKKKVFQAMSQCLSEHLMAIKNKVKTLKSSTIVTTLTPLLTAAEALQRSIDDSIDVIGRIGPERIVVGNQNRPKMTAEEVNAMAHIYTNFGGVISAANVLKKKRNAQ